MSTTESSKPIGLSIEKKPSVTEDLHLKPVSNQSESHEEKTLKSTTSTQTKKPLKDIKEESSSISSDTVPVPAPAAAPVPTRSASSTPDKQTINGTITKSGSADQPRKTFAEVTQDLKSQLEKTAEEVEKSNNEFERLVGNLEKKIESLRIQLDSSK